MKIKNYYFTVLAGILLTSAVTSAQVGINTADPKAQLDVEATNQASPANTDGLLVPRIDAFPATNPGADQNSMVVFLTTTVGADAPGFYFWDNATTDWVALGAGGGGTGTGDAWLLTGNAGTSPATNFLGTTDNQDVAFRTNNIERWRITTTGQLEPRNTGNSIFIGRDAGDNDDMSTNTNVYIGQNAGENGVTSESNVAIGVNALQGGTNNTFNVAIGPSAMPNSNNHSNNIAIGNNALFNFGGTRTGNIAIGPTSGFNSSQPNDKLYINNGFGNLVPLIGGDFATDRVGINADVNNLVATLTVGGDVFAEGGFSTPSNNYPDYVFEQYFTKTSTINPEYSFTTLEQAEEFVKANGHLPGVKSYAEVKANNMIIDLSEVSVTNLEKIEELFLYITELNADNKVKEAKIDALEARLARLEKLIEKN